MSATLRRPPRLTVVLWVAAAVCFVAGLAWWFLLRSDAPERAALPERPAGVALPPDRAEGGAAGTVGQGAVDGAWAVRPGEGVFAGYRATEGWAAEAFEKAAVGRTGDVTGAARIRGGAVEAAEVEVDLTTLRSDQSARDAILRTSWLETDRFGRARFRLAEPVELPPDLGVGDVAELVVVGDLTLHGVTRRVEVALDARWNGATIDVAGGAAVELAAFGISPPSTPFISVADVAELELQLTLAPA